MARKKGKPPVADQLRKGQSGNKKGRPRRPAEPVSSAFLFRKVATEEIEIEFQGRKMALTRWEALLRQIHTMALNNNPSAAKLIHKVRKRFPGQAKSRGTHYILVDEIDLRL